MAARMASLGLHDVAPLATPSFKDYASAVASIAGAYDGNWRSICRRPWTRMSTVVILGGGHFGLLGHGRAPHARSGCHIAYPVMGAIGDALSQR